MSISYGQFNHVDNDREYLDSDVAAMLSLLTGGPGVINHPAGGLLVANVTGLQISVAAGSAWLGLPAGWYYYSDAEQLVSLDSETSGYNRIDRVVLRLDRNTEVRTVALDVVKGTASTSTPSAPALTQDDTVYELPLARCSITGGSTSIVITDERVLIGTASSSLIASDIINLLTSTATDKPLSAAQGKALNDAKLPKTWVYDGLDSPSTAFALSAAQGRALKSIMDGYNPIFLADTGEVISNPDSCTKQGLYLANVNGKDGTILHQQSSSGNFATQMFAGWLGDIWWRIKNAGTWGSWISRFVPLTGGTINWLDVDGTLSINRANTHLKLINTGIGSAGGNDGYYLDTYGSSTSYPEGVFRVGRWLNGAHVDTLLTYNPSSDEWDFRNTKVRLGDAVTIQGKMDGNDVLVLQGGTANSVQLRGPNIRCRNSIDTAFVAVYGASFTNPSSQDFKDNIIRMADEAVRKLLDIQLKTFSYKADYSDDGGLTHMGVIAEELAFLYPDAVTIDIDTDDDGDQDAYITGVDYSKLVVPCIGMIQQHEKRIVELEEKAAKLTALLVSKGLVTQEETDSL